MHPREVHDARRYPPEFRRKVLDLLKSGRTVAEVTAGLDVTEQTTYNWRNQELIDPAQKPGLSSIDSAELAATRRRIAELETELPIARRSTELPKSVVLPKGGSKRSRRWPRKDYPFRLHAGPWRCPSPASTSGETVRPRNAHGDMPG
ncbi:transposase [Rhodococcus erythropolis]